MKKPSLVEWIIFIALCFIWGTSFLLMMEGLKLEGKPGTNGWWLHEGNESIKASFQVAALRMLGAGIVLLPLVFGAFKRVKGKALTTTIFSGYIGSFFPAICFCLAETKLNSSFAGMLNSMTPLFVITVGYLFFKATIPRNKALGIIIGFVGSIILIWAYFNKGNSALQSGQSLASYLFVLFIVLATILYGFNVNTVGKNLQQVSSNDIATIAFTALIPPSLVILYLTGYFKHDFSNTQVIHSTLYALALGAIGTAFASILFYVLVKRSGFIFASLVTYGIPFVAIAVGYIKYKDYITWLQVVGLIIILSGVYIANLVKKKV
jgi:drug/metabolite transporter (DMT)-like permease